MKRANKRILLAVLLSAGLGAVATAAPITVNNYSFETPVTTDWVAAIAFGVANWNFTGNQTCIVKNGVTVSYATGVDGNQALFLEPFASPLYSQFWQNTGATFAAGTYTLTVNVGMGAGALVSAEDATAEFQLLAYNGTYNYALGVPATTVLVKNYMGYLDTFTYTLTLNGTESFIGDTVAISLKGNKMTSTAQNVSYDNVRLDYTVPEPASLALLVLGGLCVLRRRRS